MILWRGVSWGIRLNQLFTWAVLFLNAYVGVTRHRGWSLVAMVFCGVVVQLNVWNARRCRRLRAWQASLDD